MSGVNTIPIAVGEKSTMWVTKQGKEAKKVAMAIASDTGNKIEKMRAEIAASKNWVGELTSETKALGEKFKKDVYGPSYVPAKKNVEMSKFNIYNEPSYKYESEVAYNYAKKIKYPDMSAQYTPVNQFDVFG